MGIVKSISDGLVNVVAGLGTSRDKAAHTTYVDDPMSYYEMLTMYRNSWVARAGVDYPSEDATRKWRNWRAESDQITLIEREEQRLGLQEKTQQALSLARLYGGSAIYINVPGDRQDLPLEQPKAIRSIVVLSAQEITPDNPVKDISSEYYGMPEYYKLNSNGRQVSIHASRLAIFYGTAPLQGQSQNWPDSVLKSTKDSINQRNSIMANIASLTFESKVDVLSVEGFADMLEQGKDDLILRRASLQATMKGINGMMMIDAKDSYEQKSASFSSLPEIVSKYQEEVAGAFGMPVTRLFGRSSAGMSGSGDGDERVYYDRIGHEQATKITPALYMIDECVIFGALNSRPEEIFYEWAPLRVMTESERAEIFSKTASAARSIAGNAEGAIVPMDALTVSVVNALTEMGALPGLEAAYKELPGEEL